MRANTANTVIPVIKSYKVRDDYSINLTKAVNLAGIFAGTECSIEIDKTSGTVIIRKKSPEVQ